MSDVVVRERKEPRRSALTLAGFTREREYLVYGVTTPEEAITAEGVPEIGDAYSNTNYSMVVDRIEARNIDDDDTRWIVRVTYAPERTDKGIGFASMSALSSFSFDTGAEISHKTVAETNTPATNDDSTNKSWPMTGATITTPASGGLIGWDGEKVQGVDINTGMFRFSKTAKYAATEIGQTYLNTLSKMAWTTNIAKYGPSDGAGSKVWDIGELLFERASGRYVGGGTAKTIGDTAGHIGGAKNITGVTSSNSYNGNLFVSLSKVLGLPGYLGAQYQIRLYKDPGMAATDLVASCDAATIQTENILNAENSSGIGGKIGLYRYLYDTDDIAIQFPFPWEITYNFAVAKNASQEDIGDVTVKYKKGWEYADVRYADDVATVNGKKYRIKKAKYVYLHRVYGQSAFSYFELDEDTILPGAAPTAWE